MIFFAIFSFLVRAGWLKKNDNNTFLKVDSGDGLKPSGIRYLSKNCFYAQNSENGTFAKGKTYRRDKNRIF